MKIEVPRWIFLFNIVLGSMLIAVSLKGLHRTKTIARLEAERDSLKAVKTPMREAGTAISMPPNSQVLIQTEQKDDKLIFRCWDVPIRIWKQDKNGEPYAWIIYGDSIRKWPPDTLKTKPEKR